MTAFELGYLLSEPVWIPLWQEVRRRIRLEVRRSPHPPLLLDVGGRKSYYTIGVPASIFLSDLPRVSTVQQELHLGLDDKGALRLQRRRSNIAGYVFNDMTRSCFADHSLDIVVAVEVLEHVEEDDMFVREVARVLRPGGVFLMTTPNGDYLTKVANPDHKRHYRLEQLRSLLSRHFSGVEIQYSMLGGTTRRLGLQSWSLRKPVQTMASMGANFLNRLQSSRPGVANTAIGTHHLIARALK